MTGRVPDTAVLRHAVCNAVVIRSWPPARGLPIWCPRCARHVPASGWLGNAAPVGRRTVGLPVVVWLLLALAAVTLSVWISR